MTVMFDTISSDLQLTVPKAVMWSVWCSGCYLMECKSVWFKKSKVTSGFQKTDSSGSLSAKEWSNLRGADWWWESHKFYFPVKSHLRCFKSTVMKRQKRSKVWPLKWCSCIGLIGSLSRLLSFHENMTKDVVWFSPPFKNSATQEQMSRCYLKNICILFCFTQWTSGQAESSASQTWETQAWRDLEVRRWVCVRLVREAAEVDEDVPCAARAWLEWEPWQLSAMAPAPQTSTTSPSPFGWKSVSVISYFTAGEMLRYTRFIILLMLK